jgi:hypothetical protein
MFVAAFVCFSPGTTPSRPEVPARRRSPPGNASARPLRHRYGAGPPVTRNASVPTPTDHAGAWKSYNAGVSATKFAGRAQVFAIMI